MWNESDIERTTALAEKIIGTQGRVLSPATGVITVVLVTSEHGKVWYGDINLRDQKDVNRIQKFSRALEMAVYVMDEAVAGRVGGKYLDVSDAIAMVKGADIQIIQSRYATV